MLITVNVLEELQFSKDSLVKSLKEAFTGFCDDLLRMFGGIIRKTRLQIPGKLSEKNSGQVSQNIHEQSLE